MQIKKLHNWNLSYSEAVELQKSLAREVRHIKLRKQRHMAVAGLDCAFSKDGQKIIAVVVVLQLPHPDDDLP